MNHMYKYSLAYSVRGGASKGFAHRQALLKMAVKDKKDFT